MNIGLLPLLYGPKIYLTSSKGCGIVSRTRKGKPGRPRTERKYRTNKKSWSYYGKTQWKPTTTVSNTLKSYISPKWFMDDMLLDMGTLPK